jgi:hypothetical protein
MKELELNNRVLQKLTEFDSLENIQPSENWNQSLMKKIASARSVPTTGPSAVRFAVVVLFILLLNIGFILNTMIRNSKQIRLHDSELQIISNEFLINPVSINN